MDVNGNPIGKWHRRLALDPAFSGEFILVDLQLPPDTFDYTLNIDDDWIADGSNVPGTERGAGFTPVADPFKKGPEFGSLVHCTTMAWDAYMLPIIGEVGKLR
jgi:hypothetical protein